MTQTLQTQSLRPRPAPLVPALAKLVLVALSVCLLACGGPAPSGTGTSEPPYNLVIVLSDALRASNLEVYGYPRQTAPHLTGLAAESVLFENHLANYPGTPVSVSQMMTGRLMPPLLMRPSLVEAPVHALERDLLVLPAALRDAGFRTILVSSHPWFDGSRILDAFDRVTLVEPSRGRAYAPFESLVHPALEAIDEVEEPFFLYLHSMDTHGPFRFHRGFDRHRGAEGWPPVYNAYDSEIEYTDHWLGRLVDELRRRDLLDRTVFVFTSDHGEELGEMGPEHWNRSHGYTVRRVQLHVPLLVRLPGGRAGGSVREGFSQHLDLAPTLLRLAAPGVSLEGSRIDGDDLGEDLGMGASDSEGPAPVAAYTWRYWGLHAGEHELHWDRWLDRLTFHRVERVRFNYPMSVELRNGETRLRDRLTERLRRIRRARGREAWEMPVLDRLRRPVVVAPPATVLSSEAPPTYERSPDDDLWAVDPGRRLEAEPGERPEPLALGMPWVPGRYHVRIRLDRDRLDEGWESRCVLRLPSLRSDPLELDGQAADRQGFVDLGVFDVGRYFAVELSEPRGGVAVLGFGFEPVGIEGIGPLELDEEVRRRLETLGYVD